MDRAKVNGVELEYEVRGAGEPVLLIDMLIADCFVPLLPEPALADRYQLIRYHKRGWVGSTHTPPPVSIADHAADAAALLDHLGVRRAHIAGHSTGASIGAQLALDRPEKVHTLTLLEPTLVSLPLGDAFLKSAAPVFEAYGSGDHSGAFAMFVAAASGLDWERCRALLEKRIPGVVAQSVKDADTFFGVELPAVAEWTFGPEQAAAIRRPVLSVIGARDAAALGGDRRVPALLGPARPGVHDRRRRPSPADPAPRARRSGDGEIPEAKRDRRTATPIRRAVTTARRAACLGTRRPNPATRRNHADHQCHAHRDVFTPDQKREIIERLTDAMVSIEGENMRPVTWVVVDEVASGDMGVGGKPLSTEYVKALAAGVPA